MKKLLAILFSAAVFMITAAPGGLSGGGISGDDPGWRIDSSDATKLNVTDPNVTDLCLINGSPCIDLSATIGDMLKSVYDPTTVAGDAFDSANTVFDPASSGLTKTNVQAELEELAFSPIDVTTDTNALPYKIYHADTSGGEVVMTVPDVSAAVDGQIFRFVLEANGNNLVITTTSGTDLISGQTSQTIVTVGKALTLQAHNAGGVYLIIQDSRPTVGLSAITYYGVTEAAAVGGYDRLVTSTTDSDFSTTPTDVSTGAITGTDQLIGGYVSDEETLAGETSEQNVDFIFKIKKSAGGADGDFHVQIYNRDADTTETLLGTSGNTPVITSAVYQEFRVSAVMTASNWETDDRFLIKIFGTKIGASTDPTFDIELEGTTPARANFSVSAGTIVTAHGSLSELGWVFSGHNDINFNVDENGDDLVGIGTLTPLSALHIGNTDYVDITDGLSFGDGDTGFYESADDTIQISNGGVANFTITSVLLGATAGGGVVRAGVSATQVGLIPTISDVNTGIGSAAADQVSIISGGKEMLRLSETGTATTDQIIIAPAGIIGTAATPALAFGDGDTGLYESVDDTLGLSIAGNLKMTMDTYFRSATSGGFFLPWGASTATAPAYGFLDDGNTGIGHAGVDQLSLIAGGVEGIRITEATTIKTTFTGSASFASEIDGGTETGSFSVDFATGNKQKTTLTANVITLTLDTTTTGVGNYLLKIVNGGLATLTWAAETGNVLAVGGVAPELTSSGTDMVTVYFDGTDFYIQAGLDFQSL